VRRRPKLNAVIVDELKVDEFTAHALVERLDRAGYNVIEKKTRRRERNEWWRRQGELYNAQEEERSVRSWALKLCDDIRHLEVRCSFLYQQAIAHGATPDELAKKNP
jgi:hypothetical protein